MFKLFLAGGSIRIKPFVLVGKEEIFVFFPVALDGGSIGGRSGGSAIGMVVLDKSAIHYGDFAVVFFDELVEVVIKTGAMLALIIRVIKDEDGGIGVAVDILGKVAGFFASGEDLGEGIVGRTKGHVVADNAGKNGDDDCNDNPSFLIHNSPIIAQI